MKTTRTITILEGPDGSGKTELAKALAPYDDNLVHLGPFRSIKRGLGRFYAEAMMPAIQGYANVVMDRSWLSEPIYGKVFRAGLDRLGPERTRVLERLAMRCRVVVVRCLPPYELCEKAFLARKGEEMLSGTDQLKQVYDLYRGMTSHLPIIDYDYSIPHAQDDLGQRLSFWERGQRAHPLNWPTAGNSKAPIALVGEEFTNHGEFDPLYQWPFGSVSGNGCSLWLAEQLEKANIREDSLFWINASAPDAVLKESLADKIIIALGYEAEIRLQDLGLQPQKMFHPQGWKRFHFGEPYPLIDMLKRINDELL